jgi:hypothetical protein
MQRIFQEINNTATTVFKLLNIMMRKCSIQPVQRLKDGIPIRGHNFFWPATR